MTACLRCGDGGIILDTVNRYWDVCQCKAGRQVHEELEQGAADIRAGRLVRWEDVRRNLEPPV